MDTRDELIGQAEKSGKLDCGGNDECETVERKTERSDAPAIPYGNPPEASEEPPESPPPVSSFA
jgi:hypothetical protein